MGHSWNQKARRGDYSFMTCDDVRAALSARMDGEDPQAPAATLEAHTGECAGCRDWLARAERLTRAVRVQSVRVVLVT